MAEEPKSNSMLHILGVAVVALVGGMARFADDCARVGSHMGGSADEIAHLGGSADELSHLAPGVEDGLRAAGGAEALTNDVSRVAGAADDGANVGKLLEHGLDAADAAELGLDVSDLVTTEAPDEPAHPHLIVAGRPNTPATGHVDPLVLLVADDDTARIERVATGCTTLEHRCVVLTCPPGQPTCIDGWVTDFAKEAPELVGHPESVGAALAVRTASSAQLGSRIVSGVMTPTGPKLEWLKQR